MIKALYQIKNRLIPNVRLVRSCSLLYPLWSRYTLHAQYRAWVSSGKSGSPPSLVKQAVVKAFAEQFHVKVFVETGTYMGDMIHAVKACFDAVYTIELSGTLYSDARRRFQKSRHVTVLHGNSGIVLADVLSKVDRPCLFWLDGHYSGGRTEKGVVETPVEMELHHIAQHPLKSRHIILIDDARCFKGISGYPAVDKLKQWARTEHFDSFEIEDDIIRIFNSNRS